MDDFEQYCWTIQGLLPMYMATIRLVFLSDKTPESPNIYHHFIATCNSHFSDECLKDGGGFFSTSSSHGMGPK